MHIYIDNTELYHKDRNEETIPIYDNREPKILSILYSNLEIQYEDHFIPHQQKYIDQTGPFSFTKNNIFDTNGQRIIHVTKKQESKNINNENFTIDFKDQSAHKTVCGTSKASDNLKSANEIKSKEFSDNMEFPFKIIKKVRYSSVDKGKSLSLLLKEIKRFVATKIILFSS